MLLLVGNVLDLILGITFDHCVTNKFYKTIRGNYHNVSKLWYAWYKHISCSMFRKCY